MTELEELMKLLRVQSGGNLPAGGIHRYPGVEPPGRPPNRPASRGRDYSGSRLAGNGGGVQQGYDYGGVYNAPPPLVRGGGGLGAAGRVMVPGMPGPGTQGGSQQHHRQEFKVNNLNILTRKFFLKAIPTKVNAPL